MSGFLLDACALVALGVAQTRELQLVTADHHEFDLLEPLGWLAFKWIR